MFAVCLSMLVCRSFVAERMSLHDVDDVSRFCFAIAERSGLELSWSDREDLEAYLVETCWSLSRSFEPGRASVRFSTYAGTVLRRRVIDWTRQKNGRTRWQFRNPDGSVRIYERKRVVLVSLDDPDQDRLEQSLTEGTGDRETDWDKTCGGLLGDRDRHRVWDFYEMGLEPDRRAA
jgi:DNA-directed RNA polymerase specialized sigma24 family protein